MTMILRAATIIQTIEYLTIATVCPGDGKPWNTPVYAAFDEDLNFYWGSWIENVHSRNIAANPEVFLVSYDSRAPAGEGEGVYMQARARALEDHEYEEIKHAYGLMNYRAGDYESAPEKFLSGNPRRIYKAVPYAMWMNDGESREGDYVDYRR